VFQASAVVKGSQSPADVSDDIFASSELLSARLTRRYRVWFPDLIVLLSSIVYTSQSHNSLLVIECRTTLEYTPKPPSIMPTARWLLQSRSVNRFPLMRAIHPACITHRAADLLFLTPPSPPALLHRINRATPEGTRRVGEAAHLAPRTIQPPTLALAGLVRA